MRFIKNHDEISMFEKDRKGPKFNCELLSELYKLLFPNVTHLKNSKKNRKKSDKNFKPAPRKKKQDM